jgi:four helix bundle protein
MTNPNPPAGGKNPKSQTNNNNQTTQTKTYNLERRTHESAVQVRDFVEKVPRGISNIEYAKQLIRSSGSIGANYIEADESLGKKDFVMKLKICRKESKETSYWLGLIKSTDQIAHERLTQEARELTAIFGSIISKI